MQTDDLHIPARTQPTTPQTHTLPELAAWLERRLGRETHPPTVWRVSSRPVLKLLLALEPGDVPPDTDADALFIHRPFDLGERFPGLGVLASHDPFDAQLTTGFNPTLALKLGWRDARRFRLEEKTVGMLAELSEPASWDALLDVLEREYGGIEATLEPRETAVQHLALMSTFRPEAVEAAAARGVQVYITGQLRVPGRRVALERGLGVIALGHRRSERWGLRQLALELRGAFGALEVEVSEDR